MYSSLKTELKRSIAVGYGWTYRKRGRNCETLQVGFSLLVAPATSVCFNCRRWWFPPVVFRGLQFGRSGFSCTMISLSEGGLERLCGSPNLGSSTSQLGSAFSSAQRFSRKKPFVSTLIHSQRSTHWRVMGILGRPTLLRTQANRSSTFGLINQSFRQEVRWCTPVESSGNALVHSFQMLFRIASGILGSPNFFLKLRLLKYSKF